MGVLLLIRATTEGSADYWLQQMREKGVRSQKLKVTETADSDNDEWLVDGEALKGKLKKIGMVYSHEHEEATREIEIREPNDEHEESSHHHEAGKTTHHHHKMEKTSHHHHETDTHHHHPHETGTHHQHPHETDTHHHHQHEADTHHHHHHEAEKPTHHHGESHESHENHHTHIQPTKMTESIHSNEGSEEKVEEEKVVHKAEIPRSPRRFETYGGTLDANRFINPLASHRPPQSLRTTSMPKIVNIRLSQLYASAKVMANESSRSDRTAEGDAHHVGLQNGAGEVQHEQNATARHEYRVDERPHSPYSPHQTVREEEHRGRSEHTTHHIYDYESNRAVLPDYTENRRSTTAQVIRGREEINRGFAEHPVRRWNPVKFEQPRSESPAQEQVFFGTATHEHDHSSGHDSNASGQDNNASGQDNDASGQDNNASHHEPDHTENGQEHHHNLPVKHHKTKEINPEEFRIDFIGREAEDGEQQESGKVSPMWKLYERELVFKKHGQALREYLSATSQQRTTNSGPADDDSD